MIGITGRLARVFLRPGAFLPFFWLAAGITAAFVLATIADRPIVLSMAGSIVIAAALLPIYLWCSGATPGLPIFALHSMTFIWIYGFQFFKASDTMGIYSDSAFLEAAITVASYLLLGTFVFTLTSRLRKRPVTRARVFEEGRGEPVLLGIMSSSVLFTIAAYGDWLSLSGALFPILRGVILGLNILAIFVLSHRAASRQLSPWRRTLFMALFVGYCLVNAASLFLVGAIVAAVVFLTGYTLGGSRVPIKLFACFALVFSVLHLGKGELRERYWTEGQGYLIQPWDYPRLYLEWLGSASTAIFEGESAYANSASILERSSTLALLLFVQDAARTGIPLLDGATYRPIPEVIIPRIFNEQKISAHEGNTILNVYFGLQTREATETTTIGWGLLNESFANFEYWGCAGLAVIMGGFYGLIANLGVGLPLLSFRNLFGVLCLAFTLQTEFCATVFISSFLQSAIAICGVALVFMRPQRVAPNVHIADSRGRYVLSP